MPSKRKHSDRVRNERAEWRKTELKGGHHRGPRTEVGPALDTSTQADPWVAAREGCDKLLAALQAAHVKPLPPKPPDPPILTHFARSETYIERSSVAADLG